VSSCSSHLLRNRIEIGRFGLRSHENPTDGAASGIRLYFASSNLEAATAMSAAGFSALKRSAGICQQRGTRLAADFLVATRRWLVIGVAVMAILLAGLAARHYVHGFTLVVRAADLNGSIRRIADLDTVPIVESTVSARLKDVSVRVRLYAPRQAARQTVLLVSGLHPAGIDEPRLIALARELAKTNVTVVTPDIPELSRFEITPLLTDRHDDLRRVLEYFCTGMESGSPTREPPLRRCGTAASPPPHDYGPAVVLLNVADRIVPSGQVTPLRDAVRRFPWASYLDGIDKTRQNTNLRRFASSRQRCRSLRPPCLNT
jgi:hypothetical protein